MKTDNAKMKFWDVIDSISYGLKKKYDYVKLIKPIAIKSIGDIDFVLGFIALTKFSTKPMKVVSMSNAHNGYFIIDDEVWNNNACKWVKRNMPKFSNSILSIVDIHDKVPLTDNVYAKLVEKLNSVIDCKAFTIGLIDPIDKLINMHLKMENLNEIDLKVDQNDNIVQWIVEKDLYDKI